MQYLCAGVKISSGKQPSSILSAVLSNIKDWYKHPFLFKRLIVSNLEFKQHINLFFIIYLISILINETGWFFLNYKKTDEQTFRPTEVSNNVAAMNFQALSALADSEVIEASPYYKRRQSIDIEHISSMSEHFEIDRRNIFQYFRRSANIHSQIPQYAVGCTAQNGCKIIIPPFYWVWK